MIAKKNQKTRVLRKRIESIIQKAYAAKHSDDGERPNWNQDNLFVAYI